MKFNKLLLTLVLGLFVLSCASQNDNTIVVPEHRCLSLLCAFSRSLDTRLARAFLHIQLK